MPWVKPRCAASGSSPRKGAAPNVDVGQIGGDDQRRHGAGRQALQTHAAEKRADQ